MVGSQLDVQTEPDKRPLMVMRRAALFQIVGRSSGMILVGNLGDSLLGIANCPGGVVKVRFGGGRVGGNADSPSLVEDDGRAETRGIEDNLRSPGSVGQGGFCMAVTAQ